MSLILKDSPVGIDIEIERLQEYIYLELNWGNYQSYGRAYKNKKDNKVIPEIFRNNEYVEVLLDDRRSANSFFLMDDDIVFNDEQVADLNLELIFQVNLNSLYPTVSKDRADEHLRKTLVNILQANPYGFKLKNIVTGIDNVYRDLKAQVAYTDDMNPYHICRFTLQYNYFYTEC